MEPGACRSTLERYRRVTKGVKTRSARFFVGGVLPAPRAELPDLDPFPVVHLVLRGLVVAVFAGITRQCDPGALVALCHCLDPSSVERSRSIRVRGYPAEMPARSGGRDRTADTAMMSRM